MRKGEKWYYKACELIQKYLGDESVYYRGLEYATLNGRRHLVGIFETVDPNLSLDKFYSRFKNYRNKSCGIVCISCHKEIDRFRNCIIFHLG